MNSIRLLDAKLCADIECNLIYDGECCPLCGRTEFLWLSSILNRAFVVPLEATKPEEEKG